MPMDPKRIEVMDDDGLIALVDPDAYASYINDEAQDSDIITRARAEMAGARALFFGTGHRNCWVVRAEAAGAIPSDSDESVRATIKCSAGRLLLVAWASLVDAARNETVILPDDNDRNQLFFPGEGSFRITIHRLYDPGTVDLDEMLDGPHFNLQVEPVAEVEEDEERNFWRGKTPLG